MESMQENILEAAETILMVSQAQTILVAPQTILVAPTNSSYGDSTKPSDGYPQVVYE